MNIVQITDLHILSLTELANGVDTAANFKRVLAKVKEVESPDFVVISGDLCFQDPKENVYDFVLEELEQTGLKYFIISGNHDSTAMYSERFVGTKINEYYYESHGCLFLDTAVGSMSEEQWTWLDQKLNVWPEPKVTIFMHHPPKYAQVPHLDLQYAFKEIDRFDDLLKKYTNIRFDIFTGHYHVERSIVNSNCHLFITPSCFIQISDETKEFKPDHYIPAYRRIVYDDAGNLCTTVRYLFNDLMV